MRSRRSSAHGDGRVGRASDRQAARRQGLRLPELPTDAAASRHHPRIARRGVESSTWLGRHRWKVERSLAWLLANRCLTVRYERRADILTVLLQLACALIWVRKLRPLSTSS